MRRPALLLSTAALVAALVVGGSPPVPVAAVVTTAPCTTVSATAAHTKAVEVYGEPGTFSKLSCLAQTTASGDTFEVREWDGGGYPGGGSAYFTHVASDGSVFAGSMQQTYNQYDFNPTLDTPGVGHYDPATGDFQYFTIPGTGPGDVSDVQATGANEMAFLSVRTSGRPQFGKIVKSGGVWAYDPTTARTATQFCGAANCQGPGEMAQLADGSLVSVAYFSPSSAVDAGGLIVTDDDGNHITTHQLAEPSDPHMSLASPKGIEAAPNPTSSGRSRFVVTYDLFDDEDEAAGDPDLIEYQSSIQLFEYDPVTEVITPVSAPIRGAAGAYGSLSYADPIGYGAGMIDRAGNMWTSGHVGGFTGGPLVIFAAGGDVLSGTRCAFATNGAGEVDYQTTCAPDKVVTGTSQLGPMFDLAETDDSDPTVYALSPFNGAIVPAYRSSTSPLTYGTERWPLSFGSALLNADDFVPPSGSTHSGATQIRINDGDIAGNIMWLAVSVVPLQENGVTMPADVEVPQYLVRIDLSKLTRTGISGTSTGPFGTASLGGTAGSTPGSPMGFVERIYRNLWGTNPTSTQITDRSAQLRATSSALTPESPAALAHNLWCFINGPDCSIVDDTTGRDRYARIVSRIYESAFNRWPDGPGLAYWEAELRTGARTALQIATFFASSAEFTTLYGSLGNTAFVQQIYQNVLDRPGSPADVTYWSGRLNAGTITRGGIINEFSKSTEFKDNNVEQVRWTVFSWRWKGTTPSSTQMTTYIEAGENGYDVASIAGVIMGRP